MNNDYSDTTSPGKIELLCQLANSNIPIQALDCFSRTQNALHTTKSRKQANIDMDPPGAQRAALQSKHLDSSKSTKLIN